MGSGITVNCKSCNYIEDVFFGRGRKGYTYIESLPLISGDQELKEDKIIIEESITFNNKILQMSHSRKIPSHIKR